MTLETWNLFSKDWWLEAVAPGAWEVVTVEQDGHVVARMPYVMSRAWGIRRICMPPLTMNLGPWLRPFPGKYANALSEQKDLMTELIEKLPPFDRFTQQFHHSITNWLPFYWQDFQQTTRYTYRLDGVPDMEHAWAELRSNIRTDIKKADRQLVIRHDLGIDRLVELNRRVFARQDIQAPYSEALLHRVDEAASERACRKRFFAEDGQGNVHACLYLVWDETSAYYLLGGGDPDWRNSGATSFVVWEAIKYTLEQSLCFDFEGSMVPGLERFFRSFGTRQVPYFRVTKTNAKWLRIKDALRS